MRTATIIILAALVFPATAGPSGTAVNMLLEPLAGLRVVYEVRATDGAPVTTGAWIDTTDSLGRFSFDGVGVAGTRGVRGGHLPRVFFGDRRRLRLAIPPGTARARLRLFTLSGRLLHDQRWRNKAGRTVRVALRPAAGTLVACLDLDGRCERTRIAALGRSPDGSRAALPVGMLKAVTTESAVVLRTVTVSGDRVGRVGAAVANPDTVLRFMLNQDPLCTTPDCKPAVLLREGVDHDVIVGVDRLARNDGYFIGDDRLRNPHGPGYVDSIPLCCSYWIRLFDAEWLLETALGATGTADELRALYDGSGLGELLGMKRLPCDTPHCLELGRNDCYTERLLALTDPFVRPLSGERFGESREERRAELGGFAESWDRDSARLALGGLRVEPAYGLAEGFHKGAVAADLPVLRATIYVVPPFEVLEHLAAAVVGDSANRLSDWEFIDPATGELLGSDLAATGRVPDSARVTMEAQIGEPPESYSAQIRYYSGAVGEEMSPVNSTAFDSRLPARRVFDSTYRVHEVIEKEIVPIMDIVIE